MLWGLRRRPRVASARSSRPWARRCAVTGAAKASAAPAASGARDDAVADAGAVAPTEVASTSSSPPR
jgi:hypothetical protein